MRWSWPMPRSRGWLWADRPLTDCGNHFSARKLLNTGGESGIRTHVRVSPKHAFQACAFSHSAISPTSQQVTKQAFEKRRTLTPWRACDSFRTVYQTSAGSPECFPKHPSLVSARIQVAALRITVARTKQLDAVILKMRESGLKPTCQT